MSIDNLVRRYNTNPASLTPAELQLLREAARIHIGGSTPSSPMSSYSAAGTKVPWTDNCRYRVRVKVDPKAALDVSKPNAFNEGIDALTNVSEAEFLVVGDQSGRIISVERVGTLGSKSGWLLRNAEMVRWGGRIVIVGGIAHSAYKIGQASDQERPRVVGEEVGGQVGGFGGAALATSGAILLGFGTDGIGLFLVGLSGGVLGGTGGTYVGGEIGEGLGGWVDDGVWKAIHHSAESQGDIFPPSADGASNTLLGDPLSP